METNDSFRHNYTKKTLENCQKLFIKTTFLVVSPCGENSSIEKTDTAGAAVFF